jgi:MGT family glycosyltransferase
MTDFLMTTWEGSGTTPPLMSVAGALVERGHAVRVLADPTLREEVEAVGAHHLSWTRAPHRTTRSPEADFIRDWGGAGPAEEFARMRDRLAVGPAAAFAADVREELERQRPAAVLTELLLFGPLVAAEAAAVPSIILNPTINVVPAPGVPPFGAGLMPASTEAERREHDELGATVMAGWDEALPALNAARAEQGLAALEHVLDQARSAARVLVLTSRAFDFVAPLPPVVKHVGPRLDDPLWAQKWAAPVGDEPLVLVALSAGFQGQGELLRRIVEALAALPVRAIVTTGHGIDPSTVSAPEKVDVVSAAPHREVLREAQLVVTHCGHGTTLKALAAGVPIVGVPMGRDQLDVAARVVHAGAGMRLDQSAAPTEIAAAVRKVLADDRYRAAAARIARVIAEETASDLALAEIEAVVAAEGSRAEATV